MVPFDIWNLSARRLAPELMDDPGLDPREHRLALEGLERINRTSRAAETVWRPVREFAAKQADGRPVSILDVASGAGDTVIRLKQISEQEKIPVKISGCDKSETAVRSAREAAAGRVDAEFFRHDIFEEALPAPFDVITCSLFLHHLPHEHALNWMRHLNASSARFVIINDLDRTVPGFLAASIIPKILTRSRIVHFDAVQSVRNAFRAEEFRELARAAGWKNFEIEKVRPFRFQFTGIPDGPR